MITTTYDPDVDALYVRFDAPDTPVEATSEIAPGILLDYGADGELVGIEVLGVGKRKRAASRKAA